MSACLLFYVATCHIFKVYTATCCMWVVRINNCLLSCWMLLSNLQSLNLNNTKLEWVEVIMGVALGCYG